MTYSVPDTTMMVPDVRWTMGLSLLVLLGIIGSSSGVTIMSIDFGSEWIKVAVVAVSRCCDDLAS